MSALLEARGVSKAYPFRGRSVDILSGVDFSARAGQLTAIVGHSGTGKSTLLHILGLLTTPDLGGVVVDGTDTAGLGDGRLADLRREKLGFVFQSYNLLPQHSALRNTLIPSVRRGKEAQDRARLLLERVGLGERVDHRPAQLSGGEQQRVALARALVNDPPVILADEPTGNLDGESERRLLALLLELAREGRAVVVVTHNPAVSEAADRVYRIADGRMQGPDEQRAEGPDERRAAGPDEQRAAGPRLRKEDSR